MPTKEEAEKQIEGFKSQGLKCFTENQGDYFRVFFEEIIQEDHV